LALGTEQAWIYYSHITPQAARVVEIAHQPADGAGEGAEMESSTRNSTADTVVHAQTAWTSMKRLADKLALTASRLS
jgi:hypothetical protein